MTIYYLYKKTHRQTGTKYLGQTRKDPLVYKGSGVDWTKHIQKYGYDVDTEILLETTDKNEMTKMGRYYSNLWNVVQDTTWANRIPETGGGPGGVLGQDRGQDFKKKCVVNNTGKNNPSYDTIWINNGIENKKISKTNSVPNGWTKGRQFDEYYKKIFTSRSKVGKNNPKYDQTVYVFNNEFTGERYTETSYDFSEKLKLRKKAIRSLVKGKRENYKGWKILNDCSET
jgi:hypothetical protein